MTSTTRRPSTVLSSLDPDTLASAVAGSRSWRHALHSLGLRSSRHAGQVRALCDEWGIPHEHLGHRAPPDDRLREALSAATSWPDAMARLGYAEDSGSARSTIRKHARRLRVGVEHLDAPSASPAAWVRPSPDVRHLRAAGAYIVAGAFALAGHRVCWPLEPAVYDLVVDTGERLLRVQVKTTSVRAGDTWVCSITRSEYADAAGGKRRVRYTPTEIDAFAIVDGAGDVYVIPVEDVAGMTTLSMRRYVAYRVPRLGDPSPEGGRYESG